MLIKLKKYKFYFIALVVLIILMAINLNSRNSISLLPEEKTIIQNIKSSDASYDELSDFKLKLAKKHYKNYQLTQSKQDFEKALIYANSSAEINSKNVQAHKFLAGLYMQALNNRKALKLAQHHLKKAIKLDPTDLFTKQELAKSFMFEGSFYQAAECYEDILNTSNKAIKSDVTTNLAKSYIADGRVPYGIKYFEKLNSKSPKNSDILIPLAVLQKNNKEIYKAKQTLKKAISSGQISTNKKAYANYLLKLWDGGR